MAATTQQTIEYAFPTNETGLAIATRFDFSAITLNIPETTSRSFKSVIVQVTVRGTETVAASMTSWLIGIKLAAVAFSDVTVTDTLTNSGEQQSFFYTREVSSYFNTNFGTGTSQTCQVGVQFGGLATNNCSVKLIITYEYDDTAHTTTRIKTVKIPLESAVGALTTSQVEIGTNQIPNLDSFLPESTKTYRAKFFEFMANEGNAGTTDATLNFSLDAESNDSAATTENGLNSSCYMHYIWLRDDMTTNATHAYKLGVSSVTGFTFNHSSTVLVVTYEYDDSNSTTILNSVQIPVNLDGSSAGTAVGDQQVVRVPFYVEEPATLALVQSGVQLFFTTAATVSSPNVAIGGQTARAYTNVVSGVVCGQYSLLQRFDSSGAQGSGLSIARGLNNIDVKWYSSDATDMMGFTTALIYLNYTSAKMSNGSKSHNKTLVFSKADTAADSIRRELATGTPNVAPTITETQFWLNSVGFMIHAYIGSPSTLSISSPIFVFGEAISGEGVADGWRGMLSSNFTSATESSITIQFFDATKLFRQYPNDPDTIKFDLEGARKYRIVQQSGAWVGMYMYVTYHTKVYSITGNVTGSAGGTVSISAYQKAAAGLIAKLIDTTSRSGNGSYTISWYDNVDKVVCSAREDATHLGASDEAVAA